MGGDKQQNTSSQTSVADNSKTTTNYSTATSYDLSTRDSNNQTNSNNMSLSAWDSHNVSDSNNMSLSAWDSHNVSTSDSNNTSTWYQTSDSHAIGTQIINNTDGGAISAMAGVAAGAAQSALDQVKGVLGLASTVVQSSSADQVHAYDYADTIFHGALDAVNQNDARSFDAWDRAATMSEAAFKDAASVQQVAIGQLQSAYADAKGTTASEQKLMFGVLAVAGVAVLAAAYR